jgi:hypothetical protein
MTIVAKVGERAYEFDNQSDLARAREIYCRCVSDQNDFESEMESQGVSFSYEWDFK